MFTDSDLQSLARELASVPGVAGVALGGSRARGTHRPDSDVDLGVYVRPDLDRAELSAVATRWSDAETVIGEAGSWGLWVDSGAWLKVDGTSVDLILRDVQRVTDQCRRAVRGQFAFHHQPGHPLGFLDIAYAGEVALCVPVADSSGLLRSLAQSLSPYPAALRRSILHSLWQVDFLLDGAGKSVDLDDVGYVTLCTTHAVMLLAHGWHAAAGQWVVNEKGLIPAVSRLSIDTHDFSKRAATLLGAIGATRAQMRQSIDQARQLPRPDLERDAG
ncbi:nucleotidyltransferase domain-containing protein [Microbacterium pumilum]|uniref:Nucleotidyltransferase domain-containing protein n=1 Tax=Microbacterium pumilum TaxID=344165 RepID=A0ABN2RVW0_9MICO